MINGKDTTVHKSINKSGVRVIDKPTGKMTREKARSQYLANGVMLEEICIVYLLFSSRASSRRLHLFVSNSTNRNREASTPNGQNPNKIFSHDCCASYSALVYSCLYLPQYSSAELHGRYRLSKKVTRPPVGVNESTEPRLSWPPPSAIPPVPLTSPAVRCDAPGCNPPSSREFRRRPEARPSRRLACSGWVNSAGQFAGMIPETLRWTRLPGSNPPKIRKIVSSDSFDASSPRALS